MKLVNRLWLAIAFLVILSPLGLFLPEFLRAGGAWGEWDARELARLSGYAPQGLRKLSGLWNAPLSGYAFKPGGTNSGVAYALSALAGVIATALIVLLIGKKLSGKDE